MASSPQYEVAPAAVWQSSSQTEQAGSPYAQASVTALVEQYNQAIGGKKAAGLPQPRAQ